MRIPPMISEFFEWRWAPCVGLTAGSLAFVALALLIIPTQFDGSSGNTKVSDVRTYEPPVAVAAPSPPPPRALFGASLARQVGGFGQRVAASPPPRAPEPVPAVPAQRGFSPVLDRPDPPPAPPPPEAAPPPPLPPAATEPGTVVVQQPSGDPDGPRREVTNP